MLNTWSSLLSPTSDSSLPSYVTLELSHPAKTMSQMEKGDHVILFKTTVYIETLHKLCQHQGNVREHISVSLINELIRATV